MDSERGFGGPKTHHRSSSSSNAHSVSNGHQQHSVAMGSTTSTDTVQKSRARSYSHSQHSAIPISVLPQQGSAPSPTSATLGGSGGQKRVHHSNILDQLSRFSWSVSARIQRFFRTNGSLRNATGVPRRVRFGILFPAAALLIWLAYIVSSFLFKLILPKQTKYNPNEPVQPPRWIDRGDITDLDMRPTEGTNMTTGILLNWSRLDSLREIVDHMCPHLMFKEIMIWNNKVDIHLEEKMFSCPKVRVYNSPDNMYFVARYMACAMASSPYCYFQDDDWKIFYLRSMYANFLRFPQFLHTDTNSDVWSLTNWRWCFFEDEINMHACFSWLGTGSMATRENVVNFLKQSSITEMDPLEFAYGDMYFSTYLNQVPYQLENYLMELVDPAKDQAAFSKGSEGKTRNKLYMHRAAQKVWEALKKKDPAFEREELHPTYLERDVRSPCADDRCLVLSNKNPFPDVRMFKYRPYIDIEENEKIHFQYLNPTIYVHHPFSKAVDGMDDTAYKSMQPIVQGDYIGIDMLLRVDRKVEYKILHQMGDQWIQNARLEVAGPDAVYKKVQLTYNCKDVRNPNYRGKVSIEDQHAFLNQPMDNRVFDAQELEKYGYRSGAKGDGDDSEPKRSKKPALSYYEDYGWRTQCKFVVNEPSGFRFMRLVSGRDERYPFVIYDLGWKVI